MENLSPKELYEQKKNEKLAGEKRTGKFSMFKKIFIWLAAVLVIGGGIYWFVKGSQKKISERKIYSVNIEDQGRAHINVGASHPVYNSNPPTSGWHYEEWESKGVYKEQQPDEGLIHNLEHGYIWISYKPEISPDVINNIKNIVNEDDWKIVMAPRAENDSQITLAAWGRLLKMNEPDYQKIKDFIETYRNRGPEKTPD